LISICNFRTFTSSVVEDVVASVLVVACVLVLEVVASIFVVVVACGVGTGVGDGAGAGVGVGAFFKHIHVVFPEVACGSSVWISQ